MEGVLQIVQVADVRVVGAEVRVVRASRADGADASLFALGVTITAGMTLGEMPSEKQAHYMSSEQ